MKKKNRSITLKNISMSQTDFHRAVQIGHAERIVKKLKTEKPFDFDTAPIQELEKFVKDNWNILF